MRTPERVLMYATSFAVAGLLILGERPAGEESSSKGLSAVQATSDSTETIGKHAPASVGETTANVLAATRTPGVFQSPLVIVDKSGRPRIELRILDNGSAEIVLSDGSGEPIVALRADAESEGRISVTNGQGDAVAEMLATRSGDSQIRAGSETSASLRAHRRGGAELSIAAPGAQREVELSLLASGTMGLNLKENETPRALVQLLAGGRAEIGICSTDSKAGISMVQSRNGASNLSARLASGKTAATMTASPDGVSRVAVYSADGTNNASLRIDGTGKAEAKVINPKPASPESRNSSAD